MVYKLACTLPSLCHICSLSLLTSSSNHHLPASSQLLPRSREYHSKEDHFEYQFPSISRFHATHHTPPSKCPSPLASPTAPSPAPPSRGMPPRCAARPAPSSLTLTAGMQQARPPRRTNRCSRGRPTRQSCRYPPSSQFPCAELDVFRSGDVEANNVQLRHGYHRPPGVASRRPVRPAGSCPVETLAGVIRGG